MMGVGSESCSPDSMMIDMGIVTPIVTKGRGRWHPHVCDTHTDVCCDTRMYVYTCMYVTGH